MRKWTKTAEKKYGWSYAGLDYYLTDTWRYVCKKKGVTAADRILSPLEWWIKTGRATLPECKALIEKKPYVIGKILMEKESMPYDEILETIKKKIM